MEALEAVEKKTDSASDSDSRHDGQDTKIVMDYLESCGLDPSLVSLENIDPSSLAFLAEMAERDTLDATSAKESPGNNDTRDGEEKQSKSGDAEDIPDSDFLAVSLQDEKAKLEMDKEKHIATGIVPSNDGKKLPPVDDATFFNETNKVLKNISGSGPFVSNDITRSKTAETAIQKTRNDDDDVLEINYEELEPWQRALFQRLDRQQRHIEKLENQIEHLTQIVQTSGSPVPVSPTPTSLEPKHPQTQPATTTATVPERGAGVGTGVHGNAADNPPRDRENVNILQMPRLIYRRIVSSRPIRIINLLRVEAANFRQPGNRNARFFDIHLMFKLSFICLFLRARMTSNHDRRGGNGSGRDGSIIHEIFSLTRQHSGVMLLISAIIVYFIQTGLILFLHQILIKDNIIGRVWRDEDLPRNETDEEGRTPDEGRNHQGFPPDHQREGRGGAYVDRRRGRRDRAPIPQRQEEGDRNDPPGAALAMGGDRINNNNNRFEFGPMRQAARADLVNRIDNTFIGGVIDPVNPRVQQHVGNRNGNGNDNNGGNVPNQHNFVREEIFLVKILEMMKDVLYLFGAFFLSLFPMWHPRAREGGAEEQEHPVQVLQNNDNDERERPVDNNAGEVGDGDADIDQVEGGDDAVEDVANPNEG